MKKRNLTKTERILEFKRRSLTRQMREIRLALKEPGIPSELKNQLHAEYSKLLKESNNIGYF